jgi:hypothetical protein
MSEPATLVHRQDPKKAAYEPQTRCGLRLTGPDMTFDVITSDIVGAVNCPKCKPVRKKKVTK